MNFFPPSPRPPSRREGGVFWFISPVATAPGTPAPEPERHRDRGSVSRADGGLAPALPDNPAVAIPDGGHGGFGRRIYQPYHKVLSPIPPTPFPSGEGGVFWFSYARGFAPCIPEPEPGRHRNRGSVSRAERGGASGDGLSRGGARTPDYVSNSFGKSSWGFGGFFQEAPNVSSFLRFFVSSL